MSLVLNKIQIKSIDFKNPMIFGNSQQLNATINHSFEKNQDATKCRIIIDCKVTEDKPADNSDGLSIAVSVVGEYDTDSNFNISDKESQLLMIRQAFPYVRNTIAMISSIAGIPVVTLPVLSMDALLNNNELV